MKISEILGSIAAPDLEGCVYTVGQTPDGLLAYVWGPPQGAGEIPEELLSCPLAPAGAMIGTRAEILRELSECVGSFCEWGGSVQAEEAARVVEFLRRRI